MPKSREVLGYCGKGASMCICCVHERGGMCLWGGALEHASGGEHASVGRQVNTSLGVRVHMCVCPSVGCVHACVCAHVCARMYVLVSMSRPVLLSSGRYNSISLARGLKPLTFLCHSSGG